MAERVAWLIVGAVVLVWLATTLIFPFVFAGYTPPPAVGTVMGSLAGGAAAYLFARRAADGRKNGEATKEKESK